MTRDPRPLPEQAQASPAQPEPTIAEDLLLVLFQPRSGLRAGTGVIAGETILYWVLAGAVLTDLALGGHVHAQTSGGRATRVEVIQGMPPADPLLRPAWDAIAHKPRGVQSVLAMIGPPLRSPVLARVVARGDIRESRRTMLGIVQSTVLEDADSARRRELMEQLRAVLVDGAQPSARIAALAALLSGSGTLPQFDPEIPWSSAVITRAKELEQGEWGAGAAAEAVTRTMTAIIVNNVIVAAAVLPRA